MSAEQAPRGTTSRSAVRWLLILGLPLAVLGTVGFGIASGGKAAGSFLLGFGAALLAASFAAVLVDLASRIAPGMGLIAALSNYVLTVLFFLVLLMSVSSSSIDVTAFAVGLAASVVPYVAWQYVKAQRHVPDAKSP